MAKLVKQVSVNGVEYNSNRDPQFYRRTKGEEFLIQALLGGTGSARCQVEVDGKVCCDEGVTLPGRFECRMKFDQAGTRMGKLIVAAAGETVTRDLRLDVEEHAWVG